MARCPSCNAEISKAGRFCSVCGATLPSADDTPTIAQDAPRADSITLTQTSDQSAPVRSPPRPKSTGAPQNLKSSSGVDVGRFAPGTTLGQRYRVSERLGKGGMGEVYKAEDLKLGQLVALKFLPEHLAFNEESLTRLFNEVKVARAVTHPNVCRVHDISDVDGHHFLSMEYVDGEDLASLLRRIGRLPPDKALQIARQMCAGLAAAHDKGVLHRDLKPANVMIDGRGNVRITDFGLAGLAQELRSTTGRAGTPAYMAPEQLAAKGVTTKSDIYALGLVLFEVFTGRPVYRPESLAQLQEMHAKPPPTVSSILPDVDPRVERTILRCLERDPINRPNSALAVSAALPGANPLAEALAAGETPSPELVAASGGRGTLKPVIALALLLVVVAGVIGAGMLHARHTLISRVPTIMSPEVLTNEARQTLKKVGLDDSGPVAARGFDADEAYLKEASAKGGELAAWSKLSTGQPAALRFWARWSPTGLDPINAGHIITITDPPVLRPGERAVILDMKGRLVELTAPPRASAAPADGAKAPAPPWAQLVEAAGFKLDALRPAPIDFMPPTFADARAVWTGQYPDRPEIPVRIEAAALGGAPTYFKVTGPWGPGGSGAAAADAADATAESARAGPAAEGPGTAQVAVMTLLLVGLLYVTPTVLAVRNLRRGRGDRKAALRFAVVIFAGKLLANLLGASFAWDLAFFGQALGGALHSAVLFWLVYMAVEPLIRRIFPQSMVAWSRFMSGGIKDPLVGRDLLVGAALGVIWLLLVQAVYFAASKQGDLPPRGVDLRPVLSPLYALSAVLDAALISVIAPVFVALVFVLTRSFIRVTAIRTAVECFLLSVFFAVMMSAQVGEEAATIGAVVGLLFGGATAIIFARSGLLLLMSAFLTASILQSVPVMFGPPAWVSGTGYAALALVIALAVLGAWHAAKGSRRRREPSLEQW
ncbi:MAG: protein kinase [Phycisphaerales bacterium]|nr:protein kinase [Phycisphaerales bacterium]